MIRWSLFARVGAVVALTLFALQLVLLAVYLRNREAETDTPYRFPLPDRTVAMAQAFEGPTDRTLLLRAFNSDDLSVTLTEAPIGAYDEQAIRLPRVERILARYEAQLGGRRFAAYLALPEGVEAATLRLSERSLWSSYPLRIAIELATGETLLVESRGDLVSRVYARPIGFFAGVAALIAGVIVLVVLRRETAPLRSLAEAARRFGEDGTASALPERGAAELRELTRAFNDMQTRVQELLEGRTILLGALGHDLRTYLARLRLKADLVEDPDLRARLVRDAERMGEMLDSCLALARADIAPDTAARTDLAALVTRLAAETGPAVALHAPLRGVWVAGPEPALERAVANVLGNGLKFGTRAQVSLATDGAVAVLAIADDGPGLAGDQLDRVFRPFHRADAARTLGAGGSGLGLAITRQILRHLGGTIGLANRAGGGLEATLRLPRAPGPGDGPPARD